MSCNSYQEKNTGYWQGSRKILLEGSTNIPLLGPPVCRIMFDSFLGNVLLCTVAHFLVAPFQGFRAVLIRASLCLEELVAWAIMRQLRATSNLIYRTR